MIGLRSDARLIKTAVRIENYKKALKMDPANERANEELKKLEGQR